MIAVNDLERFLLKCMMDHRYDPDDTVVLLNAFRSFDTEKKGWVSEEAVAAIGIHNPQKFLVDGQFLYEDYIRYMSRIIY